MRPLLLLLVACGGGKPSHVDLPTPLPSASSEQTSSTPGLGDLACAPQPMSAIDVADLDAALATSRDYAQRCCTGDETGDAILRITPAPGGYQTAIDIEPDRIATSAAGACVHAVFHRLLVKPYDGPEKTSTVTVRLR
jgi:hypothetical protein